MTTAIIDVGEIGPLYKIRVYHDNSGEDPSWYLEKVKMKDKDTNQEFHFFANRWLRHPEDLIPDKEGDEEMSSERRDEMKSDKSNGNNLDKNVQDEGDEDNKIEPDVLVELPAIRPDIPPPPVYMYEVGVHTGDKGAASTDTEIYMTLYGEKGDTGRRQLRKSQKHKTKFQRDQVIWFDTAVDDRKTEREVPLLGILSIPAEPKVDPDALKSEREWKIKVKTSNEDGAGTKAMVYLVIYGEEGQQTTEELNDGSLTSPSFDPGNEDEFD
ncbi:lipoxygenase homology domain-containing protein 1-like, partial [Saccoglossus kowalevskii]|uniref:Lipoxygenase homology domain-containing protein 1-like n=1 Tax=Saccoglossus kowalevskii TaxID=10224 RepID=A0ABM0LU31_SACKO